MDRSLDSGMRQGWLFTFCLCGLGMSLNLPKPVLPSAHEKNMSTRYEVVTQAPRLPHRAMFCIAAASVFTSPLCFEFVYYFHSGL